MKAIFIFSAFFLLSGFSTAHAEERIGWCLKQVLIVDGDFQYMREDTAQAIKANKMTRAQGKSWLGSAAEEYKYVESYCASINSASDEIKKLIANRLKDVSYEVDRL